jgi:two-component sensor histidine kinase
MRIILFFRRLRLQKPWLGLMLSTGLLGIALAIRAILGWHVEGVPFIGFFPAVLVAGLATRVSSAVLIAMASLALGWFFFIPPFESFLVETSRDQISVVSFALLAALVLAMLHFLNLAIDELWDAHERSAIMFAELQHRVANNMQFMAGLLARQRRTLSKDSERASALAATQSRLETLGSMHRRLYEPQVAGKPATDCLEALCKDLIAANGAAGIKLVVVPSPTILHVDRLVPISLIVSEVVTNSLKHAFPEKAEGTIRISLDHDSNLCILTVSDDGCGISKPREETDRGGLGRGIIDGLARQLNAKIGFENDNGTTVRMAFPE